MSDTDYDTPSQKLWEAERIIAENSHSYQIVWRGLDPATNEPWEPTWEKKSYANSTLADSWKAQQVAVKAARKAKKLAKSARIAKRKALRSPSLEEPEDPATQANPIPDESYRQPNPPKPPPRTSLSRNKQPSTSTALAQSSDDEQVLPPRSKTSKVQQLPPRRTSSSTSTPARSTPKVTKKRTVAFVEIEDERPQKKKKSKKRQASPSSVSSESIQPLGHQSSTSKGKGRATTESQESPLTSPKKKRKAIPKLPTSSTESTQIIPDSQLPSSAQAGPSKRPQRDVEMSDPAFISDVEEDQGGMTPPIYDAPSFSQNRGVSVGLDLDDAFRYSKANPLAELMEQEEPTLQMEELQEAQEVPDSVSPPPAPLVSVTPPAFLPPPPPAVVVPAAAVPAKALFGPVPIPRREAFNFPTHEHDSSQATEQDPIIDSSPEKAHHRSLFRPSALGKRPLEMGPPKDPSPPLANLPSLSPPPPGFPSPSPPPPREATPPPAEPTPPIVEEESEPRTNEREIAALLVDEDDAAILAVVDVALLQTAAAAAERDEPERPLEVEEEEVPNEFNQFVDQSYHQAEGEIIFDEAPGQAHEPEVEVELERMEKDEVDSDEEEMEQSFQVEIGMKIVLEQVKKQDAQLTFLRSEIATLRSTILTYSTDLLAAQTELTTLRPLQTSNLALTESLEKAQSIIAGLRESVSDAQADGAYMRDQYQNASTAAAARAQECFVAETESKRLSNLIDVGLKQHELIYVSQVEKLESELRRTKGELEVAREINLATDDVRKMAMCWGEHLAAEELEEAEREERESRMIEERQAAMLLGPVRTNGFIRQKPSGFDLSDSDDSDDDDDEEEEDVVMELSKEMKQELIDHFEETQEDPDDPDVFVCLWRPGCGEALSSRNCLEDHIIAHHVLHATDNEPSSSHPYRSSTSSQ